MSAAGRLSNKRAQAEQLLLGQSDGSTQIRLGMNEGCGGFPGAFRTRLAKNQAKRHVLLRGANV